MNLKKSRSTKFSDQLCKWVAPIVTFLALSPGLARADFDLSFDIFGRTYPLSGYADVQFGYGTYLWGDQSSEIAFGYIRPYAEFDTAGTYNSGLAGLEFFPISFLGVRAGEEFIQNDDIYHSYRCDVYNCLGTQYRRFIEARMLLGFGPWFAQLVSRWDFWTQKHPEDGDTVDASSGLPALASGDTEVLLRAMTGFKVDDNWSVLGGMQYYQMTRHSGISRFWLAGPRYTDGSVTITLGALYYDSTAADSGAGVYAGFTWALLPAIGIH